MSEIHLTGRHDDGDIELNTSSNPTFGSILEERQSRRAIMGGMASVAALFGLAGCDDTEQPKSDATVSAGASGATTSGKIVTLAGTATGATGVLWTQVSGPTVALTGANTSNATFTAPSVATATPLVFAFQAPGSNNIIVSANTTVTVSPAVLGFNAVAKNLLDVVTVPAGYSVSVLYRLGDPINAATPAYANNGTDTNFGARAGDHHDGMYYFGLGATTGLRDDNSSTRGLLTMNHENITPAYLHPNGPTTVGGARPEAEAIKEIEAHGVAVIEVLKGTSGWNYVQNSTFNRRITPNTPTVFSGPVRGDAQLRTLHLADGRGRSRHRQQLRQRLYALGQLPDLRRELGRIFPSFVHGQCGAHGQGSRRPEPLRRVAGRGRRQQLGLGGSGRGGLDRLRQVERLGHGRRRDPGLPQRSQPVRLGRRDRSV